MKTTILLAAIAGLSSFNVAVRAADVYNIDPAHSTVGFAVAHLVINTVHGKFNEFTGSVSLEGTAVKDATGTIQAKSIDTGTERRDNHLRSPDFFDVAKFPTITFQSKRTEKQGSDTVVIGDFTMHGVTKELSLPLTVKGPIKDPWGNNRIGLQAKTKINRRDFGLKYNQALETGGLVVGDEIELEINAEAVKAK
jgi:polyisoprenoid-binding protein YceI